MVDGAKDHGPQHGSLVDYREKHHGCSPHLLLRRLGSEANDDFAQARHTRDGLVDGHGLLGVLTDGPGVVELAKDGHLELGKERAEIADHAGFNLHPVREGEPGDVVVSGPQRAARLERRRSKRDFPEGLDLQRVFNLVHGHVQCDGPELGPVLQQLQQRMDAESGEATKAGGYFELGDVAEILVIFEQLLYKLDAPRSEVGSAFPDCDLSQLVFARKVCQQLLRLGNMILFSGMSAPSRGGGGGGGSDLPA